MSTTQIDEKAMAFVNNGTKNLLINGKWIPSQSGKTIKVINPATEKVLTHIAAAQKEDVDNAVKAAHTAFQNPEWSAMTPVQREALLIKIAIHIEKNAEELAVLDTLDNGVPLTTSRHSVQGAADTFRYYAGWPTKIYGSTQPSDVGSFVYTKREPLGVCGAIVPWNGPFLFAAWKIAPALATANTVVIKPSELTPLSTLRLGELLIEAGVPDGVVNIVPGTGKEAGEAITKHPDVAKISFTGSTAVGKHILRTTADTMKKVTLELGGKSPFVIFKDANIEKAIQMAILGFTGNSGQACTAGTRVLVQEDIYDEVSEKITAIVQNIAIGNGMEETTQMGPITTKAQYDKILYYFEIAKEDGATITTGGKAVEGKGWFVPPTVLKNVKNDMRVAREEIFGPVVSLISFKDEDEAVAIANDTQYGLASSVWSNNLNTAHRVAGKIQAGTVWVNTFFELNPINPFGGYKQSGLGKEHGKEAIDAYTNTKTVIVRY